MLLERRAEMFNKVDASVVLYDSDTQYRNPLIGGFVNSGYNRGNDSASVYTRPDENPPLISVDSNSYNLTRTLTTINAIDLSQYGKVVFDISYNLHGTNPNGYIRYGIAKDGITNATSEASAYPNGYKISTIRLLGDSTAILEYDLSLVSFDKSTSIITISIDEGGRYFGSLSINKLTISR